MSLVGAVLGLLGAIERATRLTRITRPAAAAAGRVVAAVRGLPPRGQPLTWRDVEHIREQARRGARPGHPPPTPVPPPPLVPSELEPRAGLRAVPPPRKGKR